MKSRKSIFLPWLLVGSVVWLVGYARWQEYAATVAYSLVRLQERSTRTFRALFDRKSEAFLQNQLTLCRERIDDLEKSIITLRAEASYYQEIQELVEFNKRYSNEYGVIAQVLLKNFSYASHFFLLDAGRNKQIQPDMAVVFGNKLVGKVIEVFPYYCKALLITDPLCKVAVKTVGTGVRGIHEGVLSLDKTRIMYMSHLEKIEEGDLVLTSGEGLVFPQGFSVGTIKHFYIKSLQYQVTVEPVINFQELAYCTILQKGAEYIDALDQSAESLRTTPLTACSANKSSISLPLPAS